MYTYIYIYMILSTLNIYMLLICVDSRAGLGQLLFECFGGPNLYTTTTTQRGWCIEAFVSILVQWQSHKSLPGGDGVWNLCSHC